MCDKGYLLHTKRNIMNTDVFSRVKYILTAYESDFLIVVRDANLILGCSHFVVAILLFSFVFEKGPLILQVSKHRYLAGM